MEDNKQHRFRFHAPEDVKDKLLNADPELMSLIESSVKPLGDLNMIQFTTNNCGKTIAQQRLIKYLIYTLK